MHGAEIKYLGMENRKSLLYGLEMMRSLMNLQIYLSNDNFHLNEVFY